MSRSTTAQTLLEVELFIFIPVSDGPWRNKGGEGVVLSRRWTSLGTGHSAARGEDARRLQTFHLELFTELQFLVFVSFPYITAAVSFAAELSPERRSRPSSSPSPWVHTRQSVIVIPSFALLQENERFVPRREASRIGKYKERFRVKEKRVFCR